ncbi:MAG: anti-CRISPR protein AcrIIA3 [Vagococcus sp.]
MKYNRSEIMKNAWDFFKGRKEADFIDELELNEEPTFSACLKEAWKVAKRINAQKDADDKEAKNTEEVKAWNWACKKLDVTIDVRDSQKMFYVESEAKNLWSCNVFAAGMIAVKRHLEIAA